MTIELWDMDVPFELQTDTNDRGEYFVRIKSNISGEERIEDDYDICLSADQCRELARVLNFLAKEIEQ